MSFINIWGNYSKRTTFSFLLFRIWQGKAILANFIIPMCIVLFLQAYNEKFTLKSCILLILLSFAGCLSTTMGIIMVPIMLGCLSIIFSIKERKISYLIKTVISCIPCIVYGMIYLL